MHWEHVFCLLIDAVSTVHSLVLESIGFCILISAGSSQCFRASAIASGNLCMFRQQWSWSWETAIFYKHTFEYECGNILVKQKRPNCSEMIVNGFRDWESPFWGVRDNLTNYDWWFFSSHYQLLIYEGHGDVTALSPFSRGWRQGTPWTSHQLITGLLLTAEAAKQGANCTLGFSILLKDTSTCSLDPPQGSWDLKQWPSDH